MTTGQVLAVSPGRGTGCLTAATPRRIRVGSPVSIPDMMPGRSGYVRAYSSIGRAPGS